MILALTAWVAARAGAAPAPSKPPPSQPGQAAPAPAQPPPAQPGQPAPAQQPPSVSRESQAETFQRAILRATARRSPADTLGNGLYEAAKGAFYAGEFQEAARLSQEFTKGYTRNLNLDDAMEMTLLIRGFRDFEDLPLSAYARVMSLREAGQADSAAAVARAALERYPGAAVRYHLYFQLAELARDRGDHAAAVAHALAVADTSSRSRLAPQALKLAGDEALAAGMGIERSLQLYQQLLERFPHSPYAPETRAQAIEMRRKLQL